ncbi:hypothetical protein QYE76_069310 [Lolium multiflorum]|uniref:Retrotransposon gag domain-containing protein n=1 Tax=Lolium multiflorum TaxID=4521 RepID=A0AAD8SG03_LOLMU|nr:hypothetical protein QYE76_069310 [Lolium multiflorum]
MTIPRHLAPTVGPSASAAGVFIRTGLTTTTGERVASGLIWRFGSLDCVSDNAGCFADRPFPAGGNIISFGGFDVYVATVAPPRYPREIVRCASPPPGAGASLTTTGPCIMQEVMATATTPAASPRASAVPSWRTQQGCRRVRLGPKGPSTTVPLGRSPAKLSSPTAERIPPPSRRTGDAPPPLLMRKSCLLQSGMEITQREQPRHGFTPAGDNPSRPATSAGGEAAGRRDRPGRRRIAGSIHGATRLQHPRQEHARGASRRRRAASKAKSYAARPAGNDRDGPRDTAESASPAPSRHRDSRNTHASSSRTSRPPSGNSGRSRPPSSRRDEEEYERPSTIKHRAAPEASGQRQPARSRLGPRVEPTDARDRLDRLVESRIAEEEGPAGPKCFGPRILNEPMIDGFQLPRDTPKYDGTAKPEDWLQDYSTAVGIAKGNKRWAVRYSPLMLLGSARTWLNNLPAGSINGWLDFEDAFISNFTGTYRRPGRPQQLEMCKQGPTRRTVHT